MSAALAGTRPSRSARRSSAYTNHTVMAEALEKWNVDIFKMTLPRIYQIVVEMNRRARAGAGEGHSPATRARSTIWH